MSLEEIKATPRYELEGLLRALSLYNKMHQFAGYTSKDIAGLAKDKPEVREEYNKSLEIKEKYDLLIGRKTAKKVTSFHEVLGQL